MANWDWEWPAAEGPLAAARLAQPRDVVACVDACVAADQIRALNNGDLDATLVDACCDGQARFVKPLLAMGAAASPYLVCHATAHSRPRVLAALLDALGTEWATPRLLECALWTAAGRGDEDSCRLLVSRGVCVNEYHCIWAAHNGQPATLAFLADAYNGPKLSEAACRALCGNVPLLPTLITYLSASS